MTQQEPQVKSRVNKPRRKLGANDTYYLYSNSKTTKKVYSNKLYRIIVNRFIQFLFNLILDGERIKFPEGMGNVYIAGTKQNLRIGHDGQIKGAAPDWVKTKILWDSNPEAKAAKKLVYHLNEATNGIRYKFIWDKGGITNVTNYTLYSIQLCRICKRAIHNAIKNGKEYLVYE